MANETEFNHDQIGHILGDSLLEVPRFQRAYSWEKEHVDEYLSDLKAARTRDEAYFMGTAVFARPDETTKRLQIVDGQQRLATTAVFYIAIRDRLIALNQARPAEEIEKKYLRGYVIKAEEEVERLLLSPKDLPTYNKLLDGDRAGADAEHPLVVCYDLCLAHLAELAPTDADYGAVMDVSEQLSERVQVLVAIATGLPEAYVIFETLNDRGADLTTADLLKNFLFSKAGAYMRFFETSWITLESAFDKPEDLVKFIRFEFAARKGVVQMRRLYRSIQTDLESPTGNARRYVEGLLKALDVYVALRNPDDSFWSSQETEVRDALLAIRRFGFESSFPLLMAIFLKLRKPAACKLLVKVAKWTVRAQFDKGRIGGQVSEESFADAAVAVTAGTATTQAQVRAFLTRIIPTDAKLKTAFVAYGSVQTARAKYLLAMLERAHLTRAGKTVTPIDWASQSFNIEHVFGKAGASGDVLEVVDSLGNLAILEKRLNRDLGSKSFAVKRPIYASSSFELTSALSTEAKWERAEIDARTISLAELACVAWPSH